jgi:hypothetical protein
VPIASTLPENLRQRRVLIIILWSVALLVALVLASFLIINHLNALVTAVTLISNVGISGWHLPPLGIS